ncbi:MAG: hypothetical protein ASARMPRED_004598 [Alectoria sarmentosa]|nr:MAG: hypothetical protein ASARMPRED_004598 [Alectoria sarmentosa]
MDGQLVSTHKDTFVALLDGKTPSPDLSQDPTASAEPPLSKSAKGNPKKIKGETRITVSCVEIEALVFGARNDPEKAFGRRKNRAWRGVPDAKEWISVDMQDKDDGPETHPSDSAENASITSESESDNEHADMISLRVRSSQSHSDVNGSIGGEKGWAEKISKTPEMLQKRREGQKRADERELQRQHSPQTPLNPTTTTTARNPPTTPPPAKKKPKAKAVGFSLLSFSDLPSWSKDNEYITTGFRPVSNSYLESFRSCLYLHNETGSIYSHLLATVWMASLPAYFYPYARTQYAGAANGDDWVVFGIFFLGSALCFGFSTLYHVVANHSHAVHDVYHRVDMLGISASIAGTFPPTMWYTLPCWARSTKIFWIGVNLAAQILVAVTVLFVRRFRKPAWRPLRGFLFSFMALTTFSPLFYAYSVYGYRQLDIEAGANRYVATTLLYASAVVIYATRIPEAWRPGWFDLWGQSHQIFHVLMAIGMTVHFSAFAKAFDYAHRVKQC